MKYGFGALTMDELAELNQIKLASISEDEAKAILGEVAAEKEPEALDLVPKTAEDQEAYGFAMHDGFENTFERWNAYTNQGLDPVKAYEKVAAENAEFVGETEKLASDFNEQPASPEEELLLQGVEKMAAEDPEALAAAVGGWLEQNGYEAKEVDENDDLEDEESEDQA